MSSVGVTSSDLEVAFDHRCELAEGPAWDDRSGELVWVDIPGRQVHRGDPAGRLVTSVVAGSEIGAAVPRTSGGLMLAVREGFAELSEDGDEVRLVAPVGNGSGPTCRMNDGKCDSAGRFWAGTVADGAVPESAALYRLELDGRVSKLVDGVTLSNGLGWNPDNTVMYYVDTLAHGLDVFDYESDTGAISNRRRLVDIPAEIGLPDGLAVDSEGYVWLAIFGGFIVRRYAPDGSLDAVISLPVSRVTSCAFGGADLGDLYITTAAGGEGPPELAGAVFHSRPGVTGLPTNSYGG